MNRSRRKNALHYARRGFLVVPMHTVEDKVCSCPDAACKRPGKHPCTAHGVKDATMDKNRIKKLWRESPSPNVGIAPGDRSGILVLDIDPRHGGDTSLKKCKAELGPLPETATSETGGGGLHLFFEHPGFAIRKDTAGKLLGVGVDVLSTGSIVIACLRHVSGKRYAWRAGRTLEDVGVAKLPQAWLDRLRRPNFKEIPRADDGSNSRRIAEGRRNNHLSSLAGTMRRFGASRKAISVALKAENAKRCSPPLDHQEVRGIVASIMKYRTTGSGIDVAEELMQLALDRYFKSGYHLLHATDGRFWYYAACQWQPVTDQWLSGKVLEVIQCNPAKGQKTASLLSQALTLLKAKLAQKDDVLAFVADPPRVINCKNGELWLREDGGVELQRHRPTSHLRDCLDVAYDSEAKCPEYDDALREIFSKADDSQEMVRHWNELVGYIIQPGRNIPLIAVLLGGGDNGKTVAIRTVIRLLGNQLVHAQRVEDLDKSRFALGSLLGKRLFLDDDVRAGARLPDGTLKMISEAKEVTGELKFHPSFNFVVRTVPVLLCNNIPSLADLSHGMRRRLMVIPFDRRFTDEDRDTELFQRIWDKELPGVLNRALKGYKRLVERNFRFDLPESVKRAGERWLQQANPLPGFIDAQCMKSDGGKILIGEFYSAYVKWTQGMGYTLTQTQQTVTRNLGNLGYATKKTNKGIAVIGLCLRHE